MNRTSDDKAADKRRRAASFGAAAAVYERSRPTYPEPALDWLLPPAARRVLDLGAGTGKLTRSLVARGLDVVAVDPSAEMLGEIAARFPAAATHVGTAERIPLPAGCVDAVFVAQAWHWFDAEAACREVARVLRPKGTLGLLWNTRDSGVEWVARLGRILDAGRDSFGFAQEPALSDAFEPPRAFELRWSYPVDAATLADLAASRSAFLTMDAGERQAVLDGVSALFEEVSSASHGDPDTRTVALPYLSRCFAARSR